MKGTEFSNRLIQESSPYLLQHAHNPVDWYPWGEEALERARAENKVILVSIGYAACHWCHVMERESFEDETVAALMNAHFINIKIDREERPDLDHIYMDAVQSMTGSGGWPLNVFLTPAAKPFYGGTYFPPVRAHQRSAWSEVLLGISKAWQEREAEIIAQAESLTQHLQSSNDFGISKPVATTEADESVFTTAAVDTIFQNIMQSADTRWGGFGNAPKFPQTFTIKYLLQYHYFTGNEVALQQARLSLDKMLEGGIYDQVGGGLARYSTDQEWLAPHFEKMLYDNALFVDTLCDAYQITQDRNYALAIRKTIAFVERELMNEEYGFYAALDADSEGEEGKFYVWTRKDVDDLLGEDAALFCAFFDITEAGNWSHDGGVKKNILRIKQKAGVFAAEKGISPEYLETKLNEGLLILLTERNRRVKPLLDDKVLLNWNALFNTALCKSAAALGDEHYTMLARKNFDFLIKHFSSGAPADKLMHSYKKNAVKNPAFLDDHACLIQCCIQLQEITADPEYLELARRLTGKVLDEFSDEGSGFFFYTGAAQKDVIIRKKEVYDGATPAGNSIMADNLFYLAVIFDNREWEALATRITRSLSSAVLRYPTSFGVWASVILKQAYGQQEIVIAGPEFAAIKDNLLQLYLPDKILQCTQSEHPAFPLLQHKNSRPGTWIYLCKNYYCQAPLQSIEELILQLKKT